MPDYKGLKQTLQEMLDKKNKDKANQEQIVRQKNEADRNLMLQSMSQDFGRVFEPYLAKLEKNSTLTSQELSRIIAESIKVDVPQLDTSKIEQVLEASLGNLNIPTPKVNVSVPPVKVPDIVMPDEMNVKGWVQLMGVDLGHPLPVQLRDADGKPVNLGDFTQIINAGGGARIVKISNDSNNPVPVTGSLTVSSSATTAAVPTNNDGVTYNSDNPIPVYITSGAGASSAAALIDSSGVQYSGSNPLPVAITSGGTATSASNIVDSSGVAYTGSNPLPVTGTVEVSGILNSTAASIIDSSGVQYSGTNPMPFTLAVSNATTSVNTRITDSGGVGFDGSNPFPIRLASGTLASLAVNLQDSDGVGYCGSNPMPVTFVTGVSASVNASLIDSGGVGYSGSNPLPITGTVTVNGALNSVITVGPTADGGTDDGTNPVKFGGIARTTNPTAHSDGQMSAVSLDSLGRQIITPVQMRGLRMTAYATLTSGSGFGSETILLASGSGAYLDLMYMMGTNNSDAAVQIDFRASTGGTVLASLQIPAGGTAGVALPSPIPGPWTDHTWTIDAPDITGTNVTISALFSKEV